MAATSPMHEVDIGSAAAASAAAPSSAPGSQGASDLDWISTPTAPFSASSQAEEKVSLIGGKSDVESAGTAPAQDNFVARPTGTCGCFSVAFYQPLFNVDTVEVVARLKAAVTPFSQTTFREVIGSKPDLYGPAWICATLVFVIGVTANVASWMSYPQDKLATWHYDFSLMTGAAGVVFGFATVVPGLLWGVFKYTKVPFALVDLLCVYGYSIFGFIPVALLCMSPFALLDWVAVSAGVALSAALLLHNMFPVIAEHAPLQARAMAGGIGGTQAVLGLLLKLYFFGRM